MQTESSSVLRGQRGNDVGLDRLRRTGRRVTLDHPAVAADEELGEVPLDRFGAEDARLRGLEPRVERMRSGTVHVDLAEHREGHAEARFAEPGDLGLAIRLLGTEL